MARRVFDKYTKVSWVTTLSSLTSPTAVQLTAGEDITTFIPKDGVRPSGTQNLVDQGDITTQFEAKTIGTYSEDFELMGYRDDTADDFWDLCVVNTVGYLVIRRMVLYSVAYTAAQTVEVRPAQMGQPQMANSAANENQKFSIKFAITAAPVLDATVA